MLPDNKKKRTVQKRSVTVNGHRTSLTVEKEFWDSLKEISKMQGNSISSIIAEIDRSEPENLSSAIRIYVLNFYKDSEV